MKTDRRPITSFSGIYGFLSNFHYRVFIYDAWRYDTAEHAYQAAKTHDELWRDRIASARTAGQAKALGNKCPLRHDWEDVKIDVMRAVLKAKFADADLFARLQSTAPRPLIEGNTWGDTIWGQCPIGTGDNWLGRLLIEIRDSPSASLRLSRGH